MWQINVSGRDCLACGICMDVCAPGALEMKFHKARTIEGALAYVYLGAPERPPEPQMACPWLAAPKRCDGCGDCEAQCPTQALKLSPDAA